MKKLTTGLMIAALAALGASAQARAKSDGSTSSQSSGKTVSGISGVSGTANETQAGQTQDAASMIKDWPQVSQAAAQTMIDRYGQPDVSSSLVMIWKDKAPFTKVVVMRDAVKHLFPTEHQDVLTQEIQLVVPVEKLAELAKFDGSLIVDRTKGTVAARGDSESSNFLALNLADEIISGKKDASTARQFYADTLAKQVSGKSSAYTDKLNFSVTGETSNPDISVMGNTGAQDSTPGASPSQSTTPSDSGTQTDDMKKGQ